MVSHQLRPSSPTVLVTSALVLAAACAPGSRHASEPAPPPVAEAARALGGGEDPPCVDLELARYDDESSVSLANTEVDPCVEYALKVTKTAKTHLRRGFTWKIQKRAGSSEITLGEGEVYNMAYQVELSTTGYTDSDFAVTGSITVHNPAPVAATITGVSDDLPGATSPVAVTCPVTFPYDLAPGASLECSYWGTLPDATTRTNTATVTTYGSVGGGSGQASVDFSTADVNAADSCVEVNDTLHGTLGTVCVAAGATSATKTFSYQHPIGPLACGDHTVDNTASFSNYFGTQTGSATASVTVHVPCNPGCTLTPGYWKTHSSYGPAPYDATWASLPQGADTIFYLSGASYYQVLWTMPDGNAYYILAHAFIAARLNGLNGASTSAVSSQLATAASLFAAHTPAAIGALKGGHPLRQQFITLAAALDAYNNGLTGPGHCR